MRVENPGRGLAIMRHVILYLAVAFLFPAACSLIEAQSTKLKTCTSNLDAEKPETVRAVKEFWGRFQTALKKNDKSGMAALASYPLSVSWPDEDRKIRSAAELEKNYDRIFPVEFREMLLQQPLACVARVGVQGFSVAEGQIWFDRYPGGQVRFFTLNVVVYSDRQARSHDH